MKTEIRLLRADEIECRVGTISETGLSLLLFKDARVDQKILDETFTPFGWRRSHQVIDGNLYCTVDIWDEEKQQWVFKQDVGTVSYTEKEKGQASDSFKRACFNWGIGRELYTAPFIWIPADRTVIRQRSGKFVTPDHFTLTEIQYSKGREICRLKIANSRHIEVFSMGTSVPETGTGRNRPPAAAGQGTERRNRTDPQQEIRKLLDDRAKKELMQELERTGLSLETVLDRYNLRDIDGLTPELYRNALSGLKKTRSKDAA